MGPTQRRRNGYAPSNDDRVPPHDLAAEQSLLGCALLARDLIVALPDPGDFYRPAHQHIAESVRYLIAAGEPVDAVTVANRLTTVGLLVELDEGAGYLLQLINATPAVSNWASYREIVTKAATLRRLLYRSTEIQDLVYNRPDDVAGAIADAQAMLADVATSAGPLQSTLDIADLRALFEAGLTPEEATLLERSDGGHLLYAGKMHSFIAEPSAGKTWFACYAEAEVLKMGGAAITIDHEDSPRVIASRLVELGVHSDVVVDRFSHIRPNGPFGVSEKHRLADELDRLNPDLVVIDAWAGALNREGLSEDVADDIQAWTDRVAKWIIRESGAALLILDHVAKDPEQRGRYARGSGHKLAVLDGAAYQLKVIKPFSKQRAGLVQFVVAKDRPGGVGAVGEIVAACPVEPHGVGELLRIRIDPYVAPSTGGDGGFRPTVVMGWVADLLDKAPAGLTAIQVIDFLPNAKKSIVRQSIALLMADGFVIEQSGGRNRSKVLKLIRAYGGFSGRPEPVEQHLFDDHGGTVHEEPDHVAAERLGAAVALQNEQ